MENNHENGYAKKEFFPKTGVILGQNCPWLSYVALNDLFSEICFVKSSANMLRKQGWLKSEIPFIVFYKEKVSFYISARHP